MHKILIVEDDPTIASVVSNHLAQWGMNAKAVTDFEKVLEDFTAFNPQLVLLDINLPVFNGYHWCQQIRQISQVPIIFLSSASDNLNMVMAMNMGADDFIPKPFDLGVLVAKVQAMLRRAYDFGEHIPHRLQHKGATLHLKEVAVSYGSGRLELTKNDFRILQALMEKAGEVVSRDDLILRLWENDSFIDDNTLTVNMTRLRKKLEGIGLKDFISTKKGLGYKV